MKIKRIDPVPCRCLDCVTGYSIPLDMATQKQLKKMLKGKLINATGYDLEDFEVRVILPWERGYG